MTLIRYNSSGELYHLTPIPSTQNTSPSTFITLSNNLWHNRLGQLGASVLNSLHRNNFIFVINFRTILFASLVNLEKNKTTIF